MKATRLRWLAAALALAVGGCGRQARLERMLKAADDDFRGGRLERAAPEYSAARRLGAPEEPIARQLGLIYLRQGRTGAAHALLARAVSLAPDDPAAQAGLAVASVQQGLLREGRAAAKAALKADPRSEDAVIALVESGITRPEVAENKRLIAEMRGAHGDCAIYHLADGMIKLMQRDPGGAEGEFRTALRLDGGLAAAYAELGGIYAGKGLPEQAAQAFHEAAERSPWRSSIRLREVDNLLVTGQTAAAKGRLSGILQHAPDYLPALAYSLNLALADKRYPVVDQLCRQILARDPDNYDAILAQGSAKLARTDVVGAVTALEKAASLFPRSAQVKYELGLAYLGNGDTPRGQRCLLEAQTLSPGYPPPILALAEVEIRAGNPQAAVLSLSELLRLNPHLGGARLLLARAYEAGNQPDQALAIYQRLGREYPRNPQVPYRQGMVYLRLGRPAIAAICFASALELDPGYLPAADALLTQELRSGRLADASALAKEMVSREPEAGGAWFLQARVDLERQDAGAAEEHLRKAITLDPTVQAPYLELARLYLTLRRPNEALGQLTALARSGPNQVALMELAILHFASGDYQAAEADYERVLAVDPHFAPALNNLACLYADQLNQPDRALDLAQRARAASPESANTADTLGWILYRRGDRPRALDLLQQAESADPDNPMIQFHLGMVHYRAGETALARQEFARAVSSAIDPASAAQARQRLAVLALSPESVSEADRELLQQRVHEDPKDGIALSLLAGAEENAGQAPAAAGHLAAAIALLPENASLQFRLARLYFVALHDPAKARGFAKNAHALAPDDEKIADFLGQVLLATGDGRWAIDLLGPPRALELLRDQVQTKDSAEAEFYLALCHLQLDDPAEARKEFTRALALHLSGPDADEARRRLHPPAPPRG